MHQKDDPDAPREPGWEGFDLRRYLRLGKASGGQITSTTLTFRWGQDRQSVFELAEDAWPGAFEHHRLLNYGYAILQVEATIALHRLGLDPSLGIMHMDRLYRGSLATDLMEASRPRLDQLVLELVSGRAFQRGDLLETRRGVCRLGPPLARELAAFSTPLRRSLAPHAENLAAILSNGHDRRTLLTRRNNLTSRRAGSGSFG